MFSIAAWARRDIRLGLLKLGAVVVVDDLDQQVAGLDLLEVLHTAPGAT